MAPVTSGTVMTTKSFSILRISLPALLFLVVASDALAQGSFKGEWTVVDANSPDWVGSAAAQKVDVAAPATGGIVDFRYSEVVADGALSCKNANYEIVNVRPNEIFQGKAGASAKDAAESAGISDKSHTLRVTCGNGESFDYHEAGKSLVVLRGDYVYTLMREDAR